MFQIISEWAVLYFKVGGIFGFGLGAIAQVIKTKEDWTVLYPILITCCWPGVFIEAWRRRPKD